MAQATSTLEATSSVTGLGGKYLTFFAGGEEYGVQIHTVREILGMLPVTPVPQMPSYILGVINLRGKVVPIIDFRTKFGMPAIETTAETCIIVVENLGVGVVVDRVSEVVNILDADIEQPPAFGAGVSADFLLGIGKAAKGVTMLLAIEKVLDEVDVATLDNVLNTTEEG